MEITKADIGREFITRSGRTAKVVEFEKLHDEDTQNWRGFIEGGPSCWYWEKDGSSGVGMRGHDNDLVAVKADKAEVL